MFCFQFLYSFHVYSFFFLPFLYNNTQESWTHVFIKNFRRLLIPYTFFFLLLLLICLVQGMELRGCRIATAFLTGNQANLRGALQYGGFLWFIPTLFSLLLFKAWYYSASQLRIPLLIGSSVAWVAYAFAFLLDVQSYAPLSCFLGLAMLLPALLSRLVVTKVSLATLSCLGLFLMIAILIIYPADLPCEYLICNRIVCPVVIFSLIVKMRTAYCGNALIREFGRYSFPIYLIHIFIYNGVYSIINYYNSEINGQGFGILLFVVVAFLSLWIGRLKFWNVIFRR
jgi:peptidoglycan/LPS O-acetylase OafA/YrhL